MWPILPFDIIVLIIDIVGESKDTDLFKELALVSHYFLQICSKHLFATVELCDSVPKRHIASSKKGFIKLLKSRPDVVNYIRKLMYKVSHCNDNDHLLSSILPNLLPKFSHLNSLKIAGSRQDWNTLDSSLISALLHLMRFPSINHIDLSFITNFPLSSLTSSINLLWLDIHYMVTFCHPLEEDGSPEVLVGMMPKICELYTTRSSLLMRELLYAEQEDGQPAFNFMDLRRLKMSFNCSNDEWNFRYLLQNAKLLEKLNLEVADYMSIVGLLSPSACTLKVLHLSVSSMSWDHIILGGICEELEALARHNMLEALSFEVHADDHDHDTGEFVGSIIQKVENILVKPGWSMLRQVSFKLSLSYFRIKRELYEVLQSLPDKYLSHLSKLESIAFNYSVYVFKFD